jgi:DNA-binding NtrC family response regulator
MAQAPTAQATILVCDDDPDVLDTFRAIFALTSYKTHLVATPATALAFIEAQPIDLLISDLIMPGMNGLALIAKARELRRDVPALLCSGFAERNDLLAAMRLGAVDVIEKPFMPQKVLAVVKQALLSRRKNVA